jgi:diguanylate cyclase (GGDEF)-like protein
MMTNDHPSAHNAIDAPESKATYPSADLLTRHQFTLNFLLSLVLAVYAALEPVIESHEFPVHAMAVASLLSLGFIGNLFLLHARRLAASGYLISLLMGAFVLEQIFHHTGISWAFILPPVVLFLNAFRRGIALLVTITAGIAVVLFLSRVQVDFRDQEPVEFVVSFVLVCVISGFLVWELTRNMQLMARAAFRDHLTGLYRRSMFLELGAHALLTLERSHGKASVVVMDLDNFKAVNDRLGHSEGDKVLAAAAMAMEKGLRGSDILARFGGDEFVALLAGTKKKDAIAVVERLRRLVDETPAIMELPEECHVTVSAGIAEFGSDGSAIDELFDAADRALLQAKRSGKNQSRLSTFAEACTLR